MPPHVGVVASMRLKQSTAPENQGNDSARPIPCVFGRLTRKEVIENSADASSVH